MGEALPHASFIGFTGTPIELAAGSRPGAGERKGSAVRELSRAFALAAPHAEALPIRDDVAFLQAVQTVLAKRA